MEASVSCIEPSLAGSAESGREETINHTDQVTQDRRIYGFLTVASLLFGLILFLYFAYQTCGPAGVVIACGVTASSTWALIKFVMAH